MTQVVKFVFDPRLTSDCYGLTISGTRRLQIADCDSPTDENAFFVQGDTDGEKRLYAKRNRNSVTSTLFIGIDPKSQQKTWQYNHISFALLTNMMVATSENATGLGDPTSDQEDERLKS